MRGPDFSEVLENACRSAGINLNDDVLGARSRFAQGAASRLQQLADRILELGSRASGAAASFDSYLEHQGETPPPRKRKSSDPQAVAAELRISSSMTFEELGRLRREFARANHPDRADAGEREHATRRMMIANMLIDRELERRHGPQRASKR